MSYIVCCTSQLTVKVLSLCAFTRPRRGADRPRPLLKGRAGHRPRSCAPARRPLRERRAAPRRAAPHHGAHAAASRSGSADRSTPGRGRAQCPARELGALPGAVASSSNGTLDELGAGAASLPATTSASPSSAVRAHSPRFSTDDGAGGWLPVVGWMSLVYRTIRQGVRWAPAFRSGGADQGRDP